MAALDDGAIDHRQTIAALRRELDQRTAERDEALAQQTATSEILGVISRSPADIQPVFEAIVARAAALCEAEFSAVARLDDGLLHLVAVHSMSPEETAAFHSLFPRPPARNFVMGQAFVDAQPVHFADVLSELDYDTRTIEVLQSVAKYRSFLGVPIFREGRPIGVIGCGRREVRPFTAAQIDLVKTFADQAAIAIENVRLFGALAARNRDLGEALEQQTATAEILQVINSSPGDLGPVFESILDKAHVLCGATLGTLFLYDGEKLCAAATHGYPEDLAEELRRGVGVFPNSGPAALLAGARLVHRPDITQVGDPVARAVSQRGGVRTNLLVPLRKGGAFLGIISCNRKEVRPYTEKEIALIENFAAQAVIAIENARLMTETREALEQQTATAEVLRVINSSPGDLAPVFDALLDQATRLCDFAFSILWTYDGEAFRAVAMHGVPPRYAEYLAGRAIVPPVNVEGAFSQFVAGRDFLHIDDVAAVPLDRLTPRARGAVEIGGARTNMLVALRKEGILLGAIEAYRLEVRPFTEKQIALLENFAAQAVIAIENARLLGELRQRTGDLQESLEYQTATSDVLKVISRSTFDVQPVFETILETAARLCDSDIAIITNREGEAYRVAATFGGTLEWDAFMRGRLLTADRGSVNGRAALEGQVVHVHDLAADPEFTLTESVTIGKNRTSLGVPLLREGIVVGVICLGRMRVQPFTDRQIELVRTFADQAVIALENARLLKELQQRTDELAARNSEFGERIEHQSATIDVLKAMSASPGDPQPVFDLIARRARNLCNSTVASLFEFDGELVHFRSVVRHGAYVTPDAAKAYERLFPMVPTRGSISCRAILDRQTIHVRDMATVPGVSAAVRNLGYKSQISLPLLRDGAAIGAVTLNSGEIGGFSDSQVALLQTFAEQAVIAITSAETYRALQQRTGDLQESLEYQTATSDVLKVISRSTADVQPVLDTVVETAARLCVADAATMLMREGGVYRYVAASAVDAEYWALLRQRTVVPGRGGVARRVALEGRVVHIADILADPDYAGSEAAKAGRRTQLGVPLLRDSEPIGIIMLSRKRVEPFTERQIELIRTFADQAVIAIENARLLGELQQRTRDLEESLEYQTATSDVLNVISRSTSDVQPVLDTVTETAARLCAADSATVFLREGEAYRRVSSSAAKMEPEYWAIRRQQIIVPSRDSVVARAALEGRVVHVADILADPDYASPEAAASGRRTILGVPLLREGAVLGTIGLSRKRVEPYTERQIELVRTFADQAVIAIENARLLAELQARTDELTRSVGELQALEEVLRAVNSSLDLDTVLATIIGRAVLLSQADEGMIYEFDEAEEVFVPKSAFGMSAERVEALRERRIKLGETHLGRSAIERAPVYVADVQQDPSVPHAARTLPGIHAVLAVPLLREDKVVGGLVIRRRSETGFAPTIATLMQTFAAQSVLAIENARLFQELAARGEEARRAHAAAENALADLRRAQDRLIQAEKMASLGQLTAGIAHEIKNPLNFVNNFAGLSVELLEELKETAAPAIAGLAEDERADIDEIVGMLTGNLEKIAEHGRRADGIVKSMLEHSRSGSGERREVDLNGLVEEALNLAYHGARAQDQSFNITLERNFDHTLAPVELVPQDITRVFLNLFGNGFYAATKRRRGGAEPDFRPALKVATYDLGEAVEIRIRDNGTGIPPEIRDKLFQPFFTTKPTGEGTGLGLSISWDIVTQQHGGTIAVDSRPGEFTEFTIHLPRYRQAATTRTTV